MLGDNFDYHLRTDDLLRPTRCRFGHGEHFPETQTGGVVDYRCTVGLVDGCRRVVHYCPRVGNHDYYWEAVGRAVDTQFVVVLSVVIVAVIVVVRMIVVVMILVEIILGSRSII